MKVEVYLVLMMWCHLIDDFFLQGCLSNLKQQSWWQTNYPQSKYKYDYVAGLACHSMMWSISIMIPTIISGNFVLWVVCVNYIIHFVVDDLKANGHKINLLTDQLIHFLQVIGTFVICYLI